MTGKRPLIPACSLSGTLQNDLCQNPFWSPFSMIPKKVLRASGRPSCHFSRHCETVPKKLDLTLHLSEIRSENLTTIVSMTPTTMLNFKETCWPDFQKNLLHTRKHRNMVILIQIWRQDLTNFIFTNLNDSYQYL